MDVLLIEKRRVRRSFQLLIDGQERFVEYRGDGFGFESVAIDGVEAVRRKSTTKMVPLFEFEVAGHPMRFEIEAGWGLELLGPIWPGHLRRFAFLIDGEVVYEDRYGQEVDLSSAGAPAG